MPPRRRKQSNAMLYTLIIFVGLFIATTTIAVVYYVKAEESRTKGIDLQNELTNFASSRDQQNIGNIVGAKPGDKSWIGTMVDYLDKATVLIKGGVPESTSAEVKIGNAIEETAKAKELAQKYITIEDPNTKGLTQIVTELVSILKTTKDSEANTLSLLADLQQRFKEADQDHNEKEQQSIIDKERLQKLVDNALADYNQLKATLRQSTDEQVRELAVKLDEADANVESMRNDLLKTQDELKDVTKKMMIAQKEVMEIKPAPDPNESAYKPDGEVILINDMAKVVHLNIGSNDHVYQGLTFTVYDRGSSISPDGKGKAEIEVFDVEKDYSAARITDSDIKKPILLGDLVANLIWDSNEANIFVIAGDFDLNRDGKIDLYAQDKIKSLIEKWGGTVADNLTIDTDYVVLGNQPETPMKPSMEELEIDPRAMDKYDAAVRDLDRYNDIYNRAQSLWIPIFRYERFLRFIGYETQSTQAGAF